MIEPPAQGDCRANFCGDDPRMAEDVKGKLLGISPWDICFRLNFVLNYRPSQWGCVAVPLTNPIMVSGTPADGIPSLSLRRIDA